MKARCVYALCFFFTSNTKVVIMLYRFILATFAVSCITACVEPAKATTYYVSPQGQNTNTGLSEQQPYSSVQFAIDSMQSGDTLVLLDGVYRGGFKLKSGLKIVAKNPRKALFTGLSNLDLEFELARDGLYRAKLDPRYAELAIKQVFYNDRPLTWAQWPNTMWEENWDSTKKWALANEGTGPGVLTSDRFFEIADVDLSKAYLFIRYGKGNSNYSRKVERFDGETIMWNDDNFYAREYTGEDGRRGSREALKSLKSDHIWHPSKSKFFLAGALDLLDSPGEWVVDGQYLYLKTPDGEPVAQHALSIKTQDYCINQPDYVEDIVFQGVDFVACSIKLTNKNNHNIRLDDVHFSYIGGELLFPDRVSASEYNKPVELWGNDIVIDKSLFAGAQSSALFLIGSDLVINNSVFLENNRHANFEGRSVVVESSGFYQITHNTFFNNHSDAMIVRSKRNAKSSRQPEISYNNIFNAGLYNSDVSGIYMPTGSQQFANVHHNWIHNIHGNAFRLDLAGSQLNLHHNVFWGSKRGINIEGYGEFNIYNNTDVLNETSSLLTRNILNHARESLGSFDKTFPPIDDWNVLNNLSDAMDDRVGPREKKLYTSQFKQGLVHPERTKSSNIPLVDRGAIQGNMIGLNSDALTSRVLTNLNLLPKGDTVLGGIPSSKKLVDEKVEHLGSYRGAYSVASTPWVAGSDWMPYDLPVIDSVAKAERFAKQYKTHSIHPKVSIRQRSW